MERNVKSYSKRRMLPSHAILVRCSIFCVVNLKVASDFCCCFLKLRKISNFGTTAIQARSSATGSRGSSTITDIENRSNCDSNKICHNLSQDSHCTSSLTTFSESIYSSYQCSSSMLPNQRLARLNVPWCVGINSRILLMNVHYFEGFACTR